MKLPYGWRYEHRAEIGSTNADLLRRASEGEEGHLWLLADRQTAGRGRRGRAWLSPTGNFHASVLLRDPAPPAKRGLLSFVCAVALQTAVRNSAPALEPSLRLKWPNDLLLDDAKVAGLLLEGSGDHVVCGFGVNLINAPAVALYPTASLRGKGAAITPAELMDTLSATFAEAVATFDRGRGFETIRERWLRAAFGLGEPIIVRMEERTIRGTFETIGERGQLILRDASGVAIPVAAGDVFPMERLAAAS